MIVCKHENTKLMQALHGPDTEWCSDCGALRVCTPVDPWTPWELPTLALHAGFDPKQRTILCPTCGGLARVTAYRGTQTTPDHAVLHSLTVACEHCGMVQVASRETRAREALSRARAAVEEAEVQLQRVRRRLSEMEQNGF